MTLCPASLPDPADVAAGNLNPSRHGCHHSVAFHERYPERHHHCGACDVHWPASAALVVDRRALDVRARAMAERLEEARDQIGDVLDELHEVKRDSNGDERDSVLMAIDRVQSVWAKAAESVTAVRSVTL